MSSGRTFFAKNRRSSGKPKGTSPEVILRKMCIFCEKRGKSYPVPALLILANRAGFLWLSKLFARCALKTSETKPPFGDPDDYELVDHIGHPEINSIHSDELPLRLGVLTAKNRRAVFKRYSIRAHKPFKGDLIRQYQRQIAEVRPQWRQELAFDRQCAKDQEKGKRRWKKVFDQLRRKQMREVNQPERSRSGKPPLIRRLFFGIAELEVCSGFRRPQYLGCRKPFPDGSFFGAIYVFARTRREAARRFRDDLEAAGYKVTNISDVAPHRSNRPAPTHIQPEDVLRACDSQEVLYDGFRRWG
ncbi:MAG: hypothetical protein JXQ71_15875 [Verrucomicrobia bacterium]|nr:hypothetical protein [Verrucomicrobiota bacterium]